MALRRGSKVARCNMRCGTGTLSIGIRGKFSTSIFIHA